MPAPLTTKTLKAIAKETSNGIEDEDGDQAFFFRCKQHPDSNVQCAYSTKHESIAVLCAECEHPIALVKVSDHETNWSANDPFAE